MRNARPARKTNSRRFSAGRFRGIPAGARSCAERCPEHVHRHTPARAGQKVALVRGVTLCRITPALAGQEVALVRGVTLCRKTPALTGREVALVRGVTLCRKTPALTGREVALVRGVTLCRITPALTGQGLFVQCTTRREYINITITPAHACPVWWRGCAHDGHQRDAGSHRPAVRPIQAAHGGRPVGNPFHRRWTRRCLGNFPGGLGAGS